MLAVDRATIGAFVGALFRYGDDNTFVQLRAFRDDIKDSAWRASEWPAVQLNGSGTGPLIEAASLFAQRCADAVEPVVFAPPVVTLNSATEAAEKNVANGIALSVECDHRAAEARKLLEDLLGPATVVVASGGECTCQRTGEVLPRLHLHWRLLEPTRDFRGHVQLKEARRFAQQLVGADGSAVPLVHPLRWPGSWHRKAAPRLARIVALNEAAEIDLGDALARLREASGQAGHSSETDPGDRQSGEPQAGALDVAAALAVIPNADLAWPAWNKIGMAIWRGTNGSEIGLVIFAAWSAKSGKNDPTATKARWDHYRTSPPTHIGAGSLFHMAAQARPGWRKPSAEFVIPPSGDPFVDRGNGHYQGQGGEEPAEEEDFESYSNTKPNPATYSVQGWLDRELPEPDLLLGPFSTTSRGMYVAETGLGKTNFAVAMAFAMASGRFFLHWDSQRPARVLFVDGEMSRRLLRTRIRDAVHRTGETPIPANLYFLCRDDFEDMQPLNTPIGQQFIDRFIELIHPR